jgi:hypothetical protein
MAMLDYNKKCRLELRRLQDLAVEFQRSNETSRDFLAAAHMLEAATISRLRQKAEEFRAFANTVPSPMARNTLLELADTYECMAK